MEMRAGTAPGAAEPSDGYRTAVAQAMVPIRQEINAGIRQVARKVDQLDRREEKLESDVADFPGPLQISRPTSARSSRTWPTSRRR